MRRGVWYTNNSNGQKLGFFPFVCVARLFLFAVRGTGIINFCFMFNDLALWRCSTADSFPDQLSFGVEDPIPIDDPLDSSPRFPRVVESSPTEEVGVAARVHP